MIWSGFGRKRSREKGDRGREMEGRKRGVWSVEGKGGQRSDPAAAAAGWLHAGSTRSRQGEAAASAAGTAAARGGAAAVAAAEAAVGLLP